MSDEDNNNIVEFVQSIEFYWRAIAVYSIILIFYMLAFGTISEGTFAINATNPIVILLMMIIVGTASSMLYRVSRKRAILIGDDFIIFKSRFKDKKYELDDIIQILFAKENLFKSPKKKHIIKIRVKQRKLMIRIRPSSFEDDDTLIKMLRDLAKKLKDRK